MGLAADGLPGPGSAPWGAPAVARILRNRTFIGDLPFRDGWVDGAHEPLMNLEVFDKAQQLADERSEPTAAALLRGDFLLTGTVVCGHCGGAYNGTTGTSGNGTKVRYYTCITGRRYGKATCAAPSVPADELETLVTDALLSTYADGDVFEAAVTAHLAQREAKVGPLAAELTAAETNAAAIERKLIRYRDDYEAERITGDTYQEARDRLKEELANARRHAAELEMDLAGHAVAPMPTEQDRQAAHATLVERVRTGSVPLRKAMFTALVDRLEVHALDDIRPVFRLGGPSLVDPGETETAGQAGDLAPVGELFACRAPGWSQGDSNP